MKKVITLFICLILIGCQNDDQEITELDTQIDKVSYCIGLDLGENFTKQGLDVEIDAMAQGIRDVQGGSERLLTDEERMNVMNAFQKDMRDKFESERKDKSLTNRKAGEVFLATNKDKEGVITLPSGLQYKVITAGTGKTPGRDDTVMTHYRGTLIDDKQFDSSYDRGEPATFPVSGVIAGWTEALMLMKEGAKWQLFIPSNLAYGDRGMGPDIGPDATLIFDIELIEVK